MLTTKCKPDCATHEKHENMVGNATPAKFARHRFQSLVFQTECYKIMVCTHENLCKRYIYRNTNKIQRFCGCQLSVKYFLIKLCLHWNWRKIQI